MQAPVPMPMEYGRAVRGFKPSTTAALIGVFVLGLLALLMLGFPDLARGVAAIAGGTLIVWIARRTQGNAAYLLCSLLVIEELSGASFWPITDQQSFMIRYPLLIVFCGPAMWAMIRDSAVWQGGFRLYLIYFGLGIISISYSLLPNYSTARLLAALLMFMAVVRIARAVKNSEDIRHLLRWFLVGTGFVWLVTLIGMALMASAVLWDVEEMSGLIRLRAIFGSPNQIGEIALATIGAGMVVWSSTTGWAKALLAVEMAVACALSMLADSRSPYVGMIVGGLLYLVWRYRLRAVPLIFALGVAGLALVAQLNPQYLTRGDVSSLTGRTDIWSFTIEKIKQRPLFGWGFEVEGEIMKARDFPIWWGPWEEGPRSSLHSVYLSKAVGLGIPALVLWVFLFVRPWLALLGRKDDPWNLVPLLFLIVIPILILDFTEGTAGDCRFAVGMIATFCWALAERQRLASVQQPLTAVAEASIGSTTLSLRRVA
jgi:O-antigen ligase